MKKFVTVFFVIVAFATSFSIIFWSILKEIDGYKGLTNDGERIKIGTLARTEFDGHTYITRHNGRQGGICHDPDCKCMKKPNPIGKVIIRNDVRPVNRE